MGTPPAPKEPALWWRSGLAAAACLLLGWFAFVRGVNVPLLSYADLGFHELGHMLTYVFPDLVTAAAGSVFQVAVPLGLAAYFLWRRRDLPAGGFLLAWAGAAAQNASVYIADAPYERLELIGGDHDWAFFFSAEGIDHMDWAVGVAGFVRGAGLVTLLAGLACCAAGPVRTAWRSRRRRPARAPTTGPVAEVAATRAGDILPR